MVSSKVYYLPRAGMSRIDPSSPFTAVITLEKASNGVETDTYGACCTPWKRSSGFSKTSVKGCALRIPSSCDLGARCDKSIGAPRRRGLAG